MKFPLRPLSVHFGSMKQKNIAESKKIKGNNSLMLHLHEAELFKFQLGLWYEMVCSNFITKILSPYTLIHVSRVAKKNTIKQYYGVARVEQQSFFGNSTWWKKKSRAIPKRNF